MQTKAYKNIPPQARMIRKKVFMDEQGFETEFDGIDDIALHLVMFDSDKPVATCRIYFDKGKNTYVVGRIAVLKDYRGKKIGSAIMSEAQKQVKALGGKTLCLHAQCRAAAFYEKQGFIKTGEIDFDEDCPHIWMAKQLKINN